MKSRSLVTTCATAILLFGAATVSAQAGVLLNEVFINPAGSLDNTQEFIELIGTPGRKLDGHAVVLVNGALTRYYPLGSIPPWPAAQEVDEIFSLDGLTLGANGILVLTRGATSGYTTILSDSRAVRWTTLWSSNPGDPIGGLENDGSNTVFLLRNRPGRTQARPTLPPRWVKDAESLPGGGPPDADVAEVPDPNDPSGQTMVLQYGNGSLDRGQPNGIGGSTVDMCGATTVDDESDDLEIVDEVSYEHQQGWEYDVDGRRVDLGNNAGPMRERRVHALDDPQGFTPDCLTRVDYRTKGPGWAPYGAAVGQMANGNNWQDTATEQWIRGESIAFLTNPPVGAAGAAPFIYFMNDANTNADAIQPHLTHVPLWLNDGVGVEYDFAGGAETYQIMAGRVNPLAVPYIPGDADRDGDCDAADIAKIAAVFGDDDWTFSNGYPAAPEGTSGDPALQTRPWDVDATGDLGIEAGDLQWTLNFQGNTDGRIAGVRYDSTSPSATGVVLNPNTGTDCNVTVSASSPCGGALDSLRIGDTVELTVRGEVTAGANMIPGQQNGIMQYVHDLLISTGGVLQVVSIDALGAFLTTRAALESPQGADGDLGVRRINGYTSDFTQGLSGAADLYRVTLVAVGAGSANVAVTPSAELKFAAGTPNGLKLGHTRTVAAIFDGQIGNPAASSYPAVLQLTVTHATRGDLNGDNVVDSDDVGIFTNVLLGLDLDPAHVSGSDLNCDGLADGDDVQHMVDRLI